MVHLASPAPEGARSVQPESAALFLVNETVPVRAPDPSVSTTLAVNVTFVPAPTVKPGDACRFTSVVPSPMVTNCSPLVTDPSESVAVT